MSLSVGLLFGSGTVGGDCINHLLLRLVLWRSQLIPWNYAHFLKYAAERKLIQQIGGRYRFIHDALRKHIAGEVAFPPRPPQQSRNKWLGYIILFILSFALSIPASGIDVVDAQLESAVLPTVQKQDWILSDIVTYKFRNYQRGDIIKCWINDKLKKQGLNPDVEYLMQIVGLPGETFEIRQGQVYINGKLLQTKYNGLPTDGYDQLKIEIPKDYYLVLAKNPHNNSKRLVRDFVSKKQILGRVIFRLWPPKHFGSL